MGTGRVRTGDPGARRGLDMTAQVVQHQVEGRDPAATDQKDGGEEQCLESAGGGAAHGDEVKYTSR